MRRDSGFTLFEVLVATTVLTVSIGSLAYALSASVTANAAARRSTRAVLLAAEKLEHLRALPFDDPALSPSPPDALDRDIDGFSDVPADGFQRRWSIAPVDAFPDRARVVHVLVWSRGDPGEASVVTIKARKED